MAGQLWDEGNLPSPLQELRDERLGTVRVLLKRDDLIHPEIVGNKWRKLRYLLPEVVASGATTMLTFGGAYSNHVRAVAVAGRRAGLRTIGVIRGDERPMNAVLAAAVADGMRLRYLDRVTYRRRDDPATLRALRRELGAFYLVPEGGTTVYAVRGCAEIVAEIATPFDIVLCAVGTGGTLAGLAAGLPAGRRAIGVSVLRGAHSLDNDVAELQRSALGERRGEWIVDHRFHHGGFARASPELDAFLVDFERRHRLVLDHVYVGKLMFALFAMVAAGEIPPGSVAVAVVTGPVSGAARSNRHSPDLMV